MSKGCRVGLGSRIGRAACALVAAWACGAGVSQAAGDVYAWSDTQYTDSDGHYQITYPAAGGSTTLWESRDGAPGVRIGEPVTTGLHRTELPPRSNGTYTYQTSTTACTVPGGPGEPGTPVCTTTHSTGPTIIVDTPLPLVNLTSPSGNIAIHTGTTLHLSASATVSLGSIESVVFRLDDSILYTDTQAPYQYSWSPAAGNYSLTAVATDSNGDISTSIARAVSVTVNNPPDITISSPTGGSAYTGSSVVFAADASDADGSVSSVTFYANDQNLTKEQLKALRQIVERWSDG